MNPLQYVTNTIHEGSLPMTRGLMTASGDTTVFAGIAKRDGSLAIRMYETEGKECPVTITLNHPILEACLTDLFGVTLDTEVTTDGQKVQLTLKPYMQGELRICGKEM